MKYRGVIFDLDGTLLDSVQAIGSTMNTVLKKFSFKEHDRETYRQITGCGIRSTVERALPEVALKQRSSDFYVNEFMNVYSETWMETTKPFAGIESTLKKIQDLNIKISVLSNKKDEYTKEMCAELLKDINFHTVLGHTKKFPLKPEPAAALFIAKEMNIKPENILFTGDTSIDMITAERSGMNSAGVLWGFRDEAELREHNATYIISEPAGLMKILK